MAKSSLIGRIAFDLVANTGPLLAPLKKAQASIGGFAAGAKKAFSIAAPIAAAAGAALSLRGAVMSVAQAFTELGNLSDESKRIGISAESLAGLQYAASQAGVDVETLGRSLQFMLKKGMSVDQLGSIADELDRISDPVRKMQLALKYFGKDRSGLINMLEGGSKKLHEMLLEAQQLGLVLTQKQVDSVEKAGDAWDRMKSGVRGVWRQVAGYLAPSVDYVANRVTDLIKTLVANLPTLFRMMKSGMIDVFATIGDAMDYMAVAINQMGATLMDALAIVPGYGPVAAGLADTMRNAADEILTDTGSEAKIRKWLAARYSEFMGGSGRVKFGDMEGGGGIGKDVSMEALMRGSQAAMSAILGTSKQPIAKETLDETKKIRKAVEDLAKSRMPLLATDLGD
jgi:hypothetical protein